MIRSMEEFRSFLKAARRSGAPLLAIRTADPASAMHQVQQAIGAKPAYLAWDIMAGLSYTEAKGPVCDGF